MLLGDFCDACFGYAYAVFPAEAKIGVVEEGVDLEGHVFFEGVVGGGFHPGALDFHHADAVAGAVEHVLLESPFRDEVFVFADDVGGCFACLHEFAGFVVGFEAEFDEALFPFG